MPRLLAQPSSRAARLILAFGGLACVLSGWGLSPYAMDNAAPPTSQSADRPAADNDKVWAFSGPTMGTSFNVSILAIEAAETGVNDREATGQHIVDELEAVNVAMSTYREDSEVTRFNRSTELDWFPVSLPTATVVARAQEIARATDGAFDVTVGPLVNRWSFGPDRNIESAPSETELAELKERVGYGRLEVRLDPPALKKSIPNLQIDLSAIAKGYAVDRVALKLESLGFSSYLVEVGGEVRCRGLRADGTKWRTGIRRPQQGTAEPVGYVELGTRSLATSGDYENFVEIEGKRYSHTIDPQTGRPVEHPLASVSVIANDCMTADALATAMSVMGFDRGAKVLSEFEATMYAIEHAETGYFERKMVDFPLQGLPDNTQATWMGMALASAAVFGLAILGMAIGVMFGRRPITGSCGGLAHLKGGAIPSACDMCGQKTKECSELQEAIKRKQVAAAENED